MKFLGRKGHRVAARIERWRPAAEELRATNPDLHARILTQSTLSSPVESSVRASFNVPEAETFAGQDPDAAVALFLAEAKRVGVIGSQADERQIEALCRARENDAAMRRNIQLSVEELGRKLDALGPDASEHERERVMVDHVARQVQWSLQGEAVSASEDASASAPTSGAETASSPGPRFAPGALVRPIADGLDLYPQPDGSASPVATLDGQTAVVTRAHRGWVELHVPGRGGGWVSEGSVEPAA